MGETDQEPDPSKRVPTFLWLVLGLICVLGVVVWLLAHGGLIHHSAFGPPAGAPATQ